MSLPHLAPGAVWQQHINTPTDKNYQGKAVTCDLEAVLNCQQLVVSHNGGFAQFMSPGKFGNLLLASGVISSTPWEVVSTVQRKTPIIMKAESPAGHTVTTGNDVGHIASAWIRTPGFDYFVLVPRTSLTL